jgi:integrase
MAGSQADWIKSISSARGFFRNAGQPLAPVEVKQLTVTTGGGDDDDGDEDDSGGADDGQDDGGSGDGGDDDGESSEDDNGGDGDNGSSSMKRHWSEAWLPVVNHLMIQVMPVVDMWKEKLRAETRDRRAGGAASDAADAAGAQASADEQAAAQAEHVRAEQLGAAVAAASSPGRGIDVVKLLQLLPPETSAKLMRIQSALSLDEQADAMKILRSYPVTHRNALVAVKTFGAWCVKQEWIAISPVANVEPIGQRNRGKKQLRIDEARKLVDVCIRQANEGDEAAVGTLTAFLLGLRASEVTDRVVRDLDDNGRLLWIEFGKTKRSRRTLEVPALLRPYLLALAKDRSPDAQLISRTLAPRSGKKRDRYWLLRHVERLCADAEVPIVCTQSLCRLHASVATDAGPTSHVVASALGHSSPAVTHAHYIDNATARRARTRRVVGKGAPDPALRVVGDEPARAASEGATAPRKRTQRAAIKPTSPPALRAVADGPAGTAEPAAPVHLVESGR